MSREAIKGSLFAMVMVFRTPFRVLKLGEHNGCYHVAIVMVLQMANLAENCDVTMVLVLQMANIGGQLLRNGL